MRHIHCFVTLKYTIWIVLVCSEHTSFKMMKLTKNKCDIVMWKRTLIKCRKVDLSRNCLKSGPLHYKIQMLIIEFELLMIWLSISLSTCTYITLFMSSISLNFTSCTVLVERTNGFDNARFKVLCCSLISSENKYFKMLLFKLTNVIYVHYISMTKWYALQKGLLFLPLQIYLI